MYSVGSGYCRKAPVWITLGLLNDKPKLLEQSRLLHMTVEYEEAMAGRVERHLGKTCFDSFEYNGVGRG